MDLRPNVILNDSIQYNDLLMVAAAKKDKINLSNFFITVNSQQHMKRRDDNDPFVKKFKYVVIKFCENISKFVKIHEGFEWDDSLYQPNVLPNFEVGPKQRRLHVHILAEFQHRTKMTMDLDAMREFFKVNLTGVSCHVQSRFYPIPKLSHMTPDDNLLRYVFKGEI